VSIAVALDDLRATAARHGDAAYVLTAGDDGRPHVSHVRVHVEGTKISFAAGRSTRRNAVVRPAAIVVLWPPHEPGGFSLLADAVLPDDARGAAVDGDELVLVATHAVLHRPAPD
jgi:hypothetical protein